MTRALSKHNRLPMQGITLAALLGSLFWLGVVVGSHNKPVLIGYGCTGANSTGILYADYEDDFPTSCKQIEVNE